MSVIDRDLGLNRILSEMDRVGRKEVVIGVLEGSVDGEGMSIAEYASANEYGTDDIPARPANAMAFDQNEKALAVVIGQQHKRVIDGRATADVALTFVGSWFKAKVQHMITNVDILPALSPSTIAAKKGSTKTLVDSGAYANAIQIEVRNRS